MEAKGGEEEEKGGPFIHTKEEKKQVRPRDISGGRGARLFFKCNEPFY